MVPARLRHLVGQGEFWASLGTASPTEARSRAGVLYTAAEEVFAVADELALLERGIADEIEAIAAIEARKALLTAQIGRMRSLLAEARHHEATLARVAAAQARLPGLHSAVGRVAGRLDEARANGRQAQEALIRVATSARPAPVEPIAPPPPPKPKVSSMVDSYFQQRETVTKATHQVMGQDRGTLKRFVEVCGDRPAPDYTRADVTLFLKTLRRLPSIYGKSKMDKKSSLEEIIARAEADDAPRLSDKTVKRHLSALAQFLQFAVDEGHMTASAHTDAVDGHRFRIDKAARDQRDVWMSDDLKALFASPVWTGCHPYHRSRPGTDVIRDARYWLPLLALYQGARLEEFADLYRRDVIHDDGTWAVRIQPSVEMVGKDEKPGHERRLKTLNSKRTIAFHPEILRLGFLAYVTEIAPGTDDPLFPDIEPSGQDGKRGPRITRWFAEYRRAVGLYREGVGMHAFRHGAITRIRNVITDWQQERHSTT